jgi:heat shock protein HslJ
MRNILIILITLAHFNCKSVKPVAKPEVTQPESEVVTEKIAGKQLNGAWQLQTLWGAESNWQVAPEIIFDFENKKFTGNTGCNSMSGKFSIYASYITIDKEIITTKMACDNYNEQRFLDLLLKVNRYTAEDNILELSQNDIVLLTFIKR